VFVRVAELSSFSRTAESLGLTRSAVSMAVQRLETSLGTRLLNRTTRQVSLTQDGHGFLARASELIAAVDEVSNMFKSNADLFGRLRVDMPIGIAKSIVIPKLPDFLAQHPGVAVEISSTDRRVDPLQEGFDLVVRTGELGDLNLVAQHIGVMPLMNVASRSYVARHGMPRHLSDLARHQLVHYITVLGTRSTGFEVAQPNGGVTRISMAGAVTVNNSEAYLAACTAGLGIVQIPVVTAKALLGDVLVELLPAHRAPAMPVSVVYSNRRYLPRRARVFMGWLSQQLTQTNYISKSHV
jgi:DNA-binding transcriptional LysR family regulator